MEKYSMEFGKKEHVLNYACQLYQLSRPAKVGAVMALIRECQPSSYAEWKEWYFANAYTVTNPPCQVVAGKFDRTWGASLREDSDLCYP
jgi:hypothetical protein